MVEKSEVERSGLKLGVEKSRVEMSFNRLNSLSLITFLTEYPKSTAADKQTVILTNVTALKIPCSRHEISC